MMKTAILSVYLSLCFFTAFAQEAVPSKSDNGILLRTGRYIDKLRIRNVDSLKVEYVKNGNLCDLPVSMVREMDTDSGTVVINEQGKALLLRRLQTAPEKAVEGQLQHTTAADTLQQVQDKSSNYYYNSYDSGVALAKSEDASGWGVATFLMGMMYGSPYIVSMAAGMGVEPPSVPGWADAKLYTEGYTQQKVIQRTKSASNGASFAKIVVTGFFLILLQSGL